MSRRHAAKKRVIAPDFKYQSLLLAKFINKIMHQGKKALSMRLVYGAIAHLEKKYSVDGFEIFSTAIQNVMPFLEVKSIRVGGANQQVPYQVDDTRGNMLAIAWTINSAKKRSEKSMELKLAAEFYDAANHRGGAIKKREDTHKMAEANKANAHLAIKKTQNTNVGHMGISY